MKYPIGQQDFQKIREEGNLYVDKTSLIYHLVTRNNYIFLSRPRRFGKSLLLSTIQAYFEGKKHLFKGLEIEKLEKQWIPHPVIHLELSKIDSNDPTSLYQILEQQFRQWEKQYKIEKPLEALGPRFSDIIIAAYNSTGQRVVILIDEYDNPLINTIHLQDIYQKNQSLLKSIYSNLKHLDRYIRFGMLTGISRFTKMNIFSGLNNLNDISFESRYSEICGFTLQEIEKNFAQGLIRLGEEMELSYKDALKALKDWYDGYHFSENSTDIYNPFSLLNALDKSKIRPFWIETATPEFLVEKLKNSDENLSEIFNDSVEETELAIADTSFSSPVSLLYQTGYLTIKGYDKATLHYTLGIPNKEVSQGFLPAVLAGFIGKPQAKTNKEALIIKESLIKGDFNKFPEQLKIFLGSVPYSVIPHITEKYFQNTLYLLFKIMGLDVESEKQTSFGRSDIIVSTSNYIYIFELKVDGSAQEAICQIEEKEYALPYINSGKQIIKIGLNFSSETRNLSSWLTTE